MPHPINSQKEIWKLVSLNEKKGDIIFTSERIDSIFGSWIKNNRTTTFYGEFVNNEDNHSSKVVSLRNVVLIVTNMWRTLDYDLFITIKLIQNLNSQLCIDVIEILKLEYEKGWTFIPRLLYDNKLIAIDLHINSKSGNTNTL